MYLIPRSITTEASRRQQRQSCRPPPSAVPLTYLLPFHIHVPDDNATVTATRDELPCVLCIGEGSDFVTVEETKGWSQFRSK